MKECQIMPYGGKHNWIDLAHRKNPNTAWFVFLGTPLNDVKPEYWEDIYDKIKQLEEQQKDFPETEIIKYTYLEINFENQLIDLIRYLRTLIRIISKKNYVVNCDLTSGLFEIRIALYIAAVIESKRIKNLFYTNKQTYEQIPLLKHFQITDKERQIILSMYKDGFHQYEISEVDKSLQKYSLTGLLKIISKIEDFKKLDLPSLSRMIKKLISRGYIEENRVKRWKLLTLTDLGLLFCPFDEDIENLKENLE